MVHPHNILQMVVEQLHVQRFMCSFVFHHHDLMRPFPIWYYLGDHQWNQETRACMSAFIAVPSELLFLWAVLLARGDHFSYCSSRGMPFRDWNFVFREWNFAFRELLREYPGTAGTLRELREWPFHSESVFPEIGVVPRLLISTQPAKSDPTTACCMGLQVHISTWFLHLSVCFCMMCCRLEEDSVILPWLWLTRSKTCYVMVHLSSTRQSRNTRRMTTFPWQLLMECSNILKMHMY